MIIDITVNRHVSQIVGEQNGALTCRIYANNYGKCARQVLKMLDRVGYSAIQDPTHRGTKT